METPFAKGFQGFLERITTVIIDPKETFEHITGNKHGILEPFVIIITTVASLGSVVGSFIAKVFLLISALSEGFGGFGGPGLPKIAVMAFAMPPLTILAFTTIAIVFWLVTACIAHLFAEYVFQGRGSLWQLFKLYGYAAIPYFLTIIGLLIVTLNIKLAVYFIPLTLASAIWSVMINVAAIQVTYKLSSGRAFISAFIAPTMIILLLSSIWGSTL